MSAPVPQVQLSLGRAAGAKSVATMLPSLLAAGVSVGGDGRWPAVQPAPPQLKMPWLPATSTPPEHDDPEPGPSLPKPNCSPKVTLSVPLAVALADIVRVLPLIETTMVPLGMPVPVTWSSGDTPGNPPEGTVKVAEPDATVTEGIVTGARYRMLPFMAIQPDSCPVNADAGVVATKVRPVAVPAISKRLLPRDNGCDRRARRDRGPMARIRLESLDRECAG
jgi:hypothetical protein